MNSSCMHAFIYILDPPTSFGTNHTLPIGLLCEDKLIQMHSCLSASDLSFLQKLCLIAYDCHLCSWLQICGSSLCFTGFCVVYIVPKLQYYLGNCLLFLFYLFIHLKHLKGTSLKHRGLNTHFLPVPKIQDLS